MSKGRVEGEIIESAERSCSFELTIDSSEFDSGLRRRTSFYPALASRKARSIMSVVSKEKEPARFLVALFLLRIRVASSRMLANVFTHERWNRVAFKYKSPGILVQIFARRHVVPSGKRQKRKRSIDSFARSGERDMTGRKFS